MAIQPETDSVVIPKSDRDDTVELLEWYWQRGLATLSLGRAKKAEFAS
ncbi:hypothetical protein [Altericroceibacterium spongiae]|nr:hypothetical protein [Altericroceibacterium spongiae]